MKKLVLCGFLFTGLAIAACEKNNDDKLNDQDQDFLVKASVSNSAEISAATLATSKATNARVKAFAQSMLTEHNLAQTDLKTTGNAVGYPVKDTIDPAHVAIAAALSTKSGRAFDSAYMHTQVADHQATVSLFQNELSNGRHRDVLNYANVYLPHIQMHLQMADSIANAYFKR